MSKPFQLRVARAESSFGAVRSYSSRESRRRIAEWWRAVGEKVEVRDAPYQAWWEWRP